MGEEGTVTNYIYAMCFSGAGVALLFAVDSTLYFALAAAGAFTAGAICGWRQIISYRRYVYWLAKYKEEKQRQRK